MAIASIPYENFQEFNIYDNTVSIRYRIVSEDQNYRSYWSPIYRIDPGLLFVQGIAQEPGQISGYKDSNTNYAIVTWDAVSIYKNSPIIELPPGMVGPLYISGLYPPMSIYVGKLNNYDIWTSWSDINDENPSSWSNKERTTNTYTNILVKDYVSANGTTETPEYLDIEIYRPGIPIKRYSPDVIEIDSSSSVDTSTNEIVFEKEHGIENIKDIIFYSLQEISIPSSLVSGSRYWISPISKNRIAFYATEADANSDTNRIDLPFIMPNSEIVLKIFDQSLVNTGSNYISMPNHGFSLGDVVVYRHETGETPIGGIENGTIFWVRPEGDNYFRIYESFIATRTYDLSGDPNIITSVGTGYGSFSRYPFLLYKKKIQLNPTP